MTTSKLRSHLTYANVGVTVALVLATTGFAVASIPGRGGIISACYRGSGGGLRAIDTAKKGSAGKCTKKEKALSWNQQGPRGLQGVPGQPGPQGVQGVRGLSGPPGPTFGAATMSNQQTPAASPDESSANATAQRRHFDFNLPTGGNVYIRYFDRFMARACSAGGSDAGLYLDGAPIPNGGQQISSVPASPSATELISMTVAAAGPHAAEVREDCFSGTLGTDSESGFGTWTVLLLGG
jgi:hypothetical protein